MGLKEDPAATRHSLEASGIMMPAWNLPYCGQRLPEPWKGRPLYSTPSQTARQLYPWGAHIPGAVTSAI